MRIFLDIGHPAHVHYFRNTVKSLMNDGHKFLITAREKDITHKLLDNYDIPYISRGKGGSNLINKFFYLFKANHQLFILSRKFKPDLFISFASPYAGQVAYFLNIPHISFTDTEHAKLGILAFLPFCDLVVTPTAYKDNFGKKHIYFNGYMEQCYLEKKYFTPNINSLIDLNINNNKKYIIIRLVSWEASHDIGQKGVKIESLLKLINKLKNYATIFISSEGKIPRELKKYRLSIDPTKMHDVLYYATLFIGEGATMASECALIGTPSIYINTLSTGYLEEQQKYGLVYMFNSMQGVKDKALDILSQKNIKEIQQEKSSKILKKKIDVNKFMKNLILNYQNKILLKN
ncbi:MAG: DUF354 domain-containing protein [Candidatus Neomarinimicrobiota bacterium]